MTQATTLTKIDTFRAEVVGMGGVTPPPSGNVFTKYGLVFTKTGLVPFAFGHPFKRGDVPKGSTVVADCAEFQFDPWCYYDDGSVRAARIAGYCNVAQVGLTQISFSLGVPPVVPPFTSKPQSQVDVHIFVNGSEPPVTGVKLLAYGSIAIYEEITRIVNSQIRVIYTVIQFRHGEILVPPPVVDSANFMLPNQPNQLLNVKSVVGGVTTFIAVDDPLTSIDERYDVKHHTRPFATRGTQWLQGIGCDLNVYPEIDKKYACSCECYPPIVPGPNTGVAYRQTYDINYIGEDGADMPGPGYGPHIALISRSSIFPLTVGGRKHWNYMLAEALSAGSWSWHLRDEATGDIPLFRSYPTHSRQSNIPAGSGPRNGNHDIAHHPSLCYTAAIMTGWQSMIDNVLMLAASNHFQQWPQLRFNEKGVLRTDIGMNTVRGGAWALRSLSQAVAICPQGHPLQQDLINSWQENMKWYRGRYVDGTIDGGKWVNNLGALGTYTSDGHSPYNNPADIGSSTAYWDAAWMHAMVTQTLGCALYMHLPISAAAQADTSAVFMQSTKMIVGLCGDNITAANYRRFGYYAYPLGPIGSSIPPNSGWYPNHKASYDHYTSILGLQSLDPALGGTLKQHNLEKDVLAQDWLTGFLSYEFPALVFAKMHGAPGADAAWTRVTSSASWSLIANGPGIEPEWVGMMVPGIKHPGGV